MRALRVYSCGYCAVVLKAAWAVSRIWTAGFAVAPDYDGKGVNYGRTMTNPMTSRSAAFFAAGGFVAALFIAGAAHAITEATFRYSTPQTGHLSLPAAAFGVETDTTAYTNNGLIAASASAGYADFIAPVNLPDGATMNGLSIWYKPTSGNTMTVELARQRLSDGSLDFIVFQEPAGTSGVRTLTSYPITDAAMRTVDNTHFAYYMVMAISTPNDWFYGARITYKYSSAGD
jgi:hypothetical protein